jgi:outer membrane protein assembly factor BamB
MAADEAALYVPTTRGRFYALEAAQGRLRWQVTLPDTTVRFSTPAVDGALVVVGASDGKLRAFDTATGDLRWTFENDAALTAAPLLTPNTVYVGSMGRLLFAIDRATGVAKGQLELKGRVKSALAARDGYLVVLAEPRFVYLFKSASVSDVVSP